MYALFVPAIEIEQELKLAQIEGVKNNSFVNEMFRDIRLKKESKMNIKQFTAHRMVLASGSTSAYEGGKRFSFDYLPPTQKNSNTETS